MGVKISKRPRSIVNNRSSGERRRGCSLVESMVHPFEECCISYEATYT